MITPFATRPSPAPDASAVLARHGRTFAFAGRFLSPGQRRRAAELYAFCRHVDDLADRTDDGEVAGNKLRDMGASIAGGVARCHHTEMMLALMAETAMPVEPVLALIDGVTGDLNTVRFCSERQLLRYSYQVAGSVGVMMCAVLEVREPRAFRHGVDLGIAMQLTNIARDVAEDAAQGRIYLPEDWTGKLSVADILQPGEATAAALQAAVARTLAVAECYYESGLAGLGYLPARSRLGIYLAAQLYRTIGFRIAARDFRSWRGRERLSTLDKIYHGLWLAAKRAVGRENAGTVFHAGYLHRHLQGLFGTNGSLHD